MDVLLSRRYGWIFPLLMIILLVPVTNWYDLELSSKFYHPENKQFTNNTYLSLVYHYAQLPALFTGITAGILWFISFKVKRLACYRKYLAVLWILLAIVPGLLVNAVLKPNWGRPRPRHVIELGGGAEFRPFYSPNWGPWKRDFFKSMPSGHASMGFYFLSFILIGYRSKKRWLIALGVALTLFLSISLGWARIAQGGHFLSDVLMAGILTWTFLLILDQLFLYDPTEKLSHEAAN